MKKALFAAAILLINSAFALDMGAQAVKDRISAKLMPQVGPEKHVGAVVAVYSKGVEKFLFLGTTQKGISQSPTKKTMYEIGSITKPIVGLFLANAVEEGRLKATDTIDKFRSEWKNQLTSDITLEQLAGHTSGLPASPCNMKDIPYAYYDYSEKDLIEGLRDDAPRYLADCKIDKNNPTSKRNYSNWGYGLLGYLLEKSSQTSLQNLVKELALPNTVIYLDSKQKKLLAQGYDSSSNEVKYRQRKFLLGSGSIVSNAEDLLSFAKTYLKDGKNHSRTPYGWWISKEGDLFKDGMTFAYSSYVAIYPRLDLIILYLTNSGSAFDCFWEAAEGVDCKT